MSPEPTKPPQIPFSRGFILGLPIFAVLVASALVVYLIAGALGWKDRIQILAGMCVGPLLGFVLLGLFFLIVRPKIY